jgi:hypothetical protein
MAYQINLTGQEIDERLQNIGTAEDVAAADGTLYARISKNADDVDELRDTVGHIDSAQTATDKTVTQHTADINTLQTAVGDVKKDVEKNAKAISENTTTLTEHDARLSDVEGLVHRGLPVYGVEWDVNQTSPDVKRIGIPELHRTLPCHQLRGCLLADNGTVNEYLPQDDWTSATRDGSKGQVMVEIPEMWMKFEIDGDMRRVLLSPVAIGGFKHYQKRYVSAYEATVQRSTNKLASVVNTTEDYRGGRNDASLDDTAYTLLGKPAGGYIKSTYRIYARNRFPSVAWNMYVYDVHCQLTWLFVVEYATLNSQKTYNASLTVDGFHQGGLGSGATNMTHAEQVEFQYSPVVACGYTDSFGNNTGVKDVSVALSSGDKTFSVCRYRGVENIIGNLSALVDGLWLQTNGATIVKTEAVTFSSTMPSYSKPTCWRTMNSGYIRNIDDSAFINGWAIPKAIGGSDKTYYCDYNAINADTDELCAYFGGSENSFSNAGLFFFGTMSLLRTDSSIGTRLCYLPQEDNSGTLRDLYVSAGAKYNEATGYYELNGLTDITEEEMRVIWQEDLSGWYRKGRTNLTRYISVKGNTGGYNGGIDIACICINNKNLQVFNLGANCFARYMDSAFRECSNLETIDTRFRVVPYDTSLGINTFRGCIKLKDVRFNNHYLRMKATLNLYDSPLISKESVLSAITTTDNASATSAGFLTITLHADAYARLKDDADIIAALEAKNGVVTLVSA